MQRELKFRGLQIPNNRFVYGDYFFDKSVLQAFIITDSKNVGIYSESVGQYTGLRDKNGSEIYEGDIIEDSNGRILSVKWSVKFASFCLNSNDWMFLHYFDEACDANDVEIIGNIHENPELLKP